MDAFKLSSRNETELQQKLTAVKTFTDYIRMEAGLRKCTRAVF
jgi:hypothetical protein